MSAQKKESAEYRFVLHYIWEENLGAQAAGVRLIWRFHCKSFVDITLNGAILWRERQCGVKFVKWMWSS